MIRQYGVLAYDIADDGEPRILLITSRSTRRWVIPRGNPIPGLSPAQSAAQEAYEEAGIIGPVEADAIGLYSYEKRRRLGFAVPAVVHLFRMNVAEERDEWPEKGQRERRWFPAEEAAAAVHEPELAKLIRLAGGEVSQK